MVSKQVPFQVSEVLGFSTPDPLLVVQSTWKLIADRHHDFGEVFYDRLFTVAPQFSNLFSGDMSAQALMLTYMLETVVYASSRPEYLALGLTALGGRHSEYGVKSKHYEVFRDCLLDAIRVTLGDERYTEEVAGAWESTLDSLTQMMQRGAQHNRTS